MKRVPALLCALVLGIATAVDGADKNDYPVKPVRFIVGFSPGGANDIIARLMAQQLTTRFGQQVVVDNRAGANGIVGNSIAANAAPDGYTLLLVAASFAVDLARGLKLPYDPLHAFTPVIRVASAPYVLVVNPAMPVESVADLIAFAKAKPGQLSIAHAGVGNLAHVAGEMLNAMAGINILSVAYRGGSAALIDVMAGQVQLALPTFPPALPFIRSGKLRALAVTSAERSSLMPELPTIAETVQDYSAIGWWAVLLPAATPPAVVQKLNDAINDALAAPEVKARLAALGAEAAGGTPPQLLAFIRAETLKWSKVIRAAGLKIR